MTALLTLLGPLLSGLLTVARWIFNAKAKKKLSDEEFVAYILAHQKRKARAGRAALDWEDALREAQEQIAKADLAKVSGYTRTT